MSNTEYKSYEESYEGRIEEFVVDKSWIDAWSITNGIADQEVTHISEKQPDGTFKIFEVL